MTAAGCAIASVRGIGGNSVRAMSHSERGDGVQAGAGRGGGTTGEGMLPCSRHGGEDEAAVVTVVREDREGGPGGEEGMARHPGTTSWVVTYDKGSDSTPPVPTSEGNSSSSAGSSSGVPRVRVRAAAGITRDALL